MLEEVIKDDLELQVVPKYLPQDRSALWRCRMRNKIAARAQNNETNGLKQINGINESNLTSSINRTYNSNLGNTPSIINSPQNHLVYSNTNDSYRLSCGDNTVQNGYNQNSSNSADDTMNFATELKSFLTSNYSENIGDNQYYGAQVNDGIHNFSSGQNNTEICRPSTSRIQGDFYENWNVPTNTTFNNFQVPETVSSFRQTHSKR